MDDKINRLVELRDIRDKASAEMAAILGGGEPKEKKERKPQTCSICQSSEHSARTCPQKMPAAQI